MNKLYISADIEGAAGICWWEETIHNNPDNAYFARQMTREASAICEAADKLGWECTVKDAHDTARNILPEELYPAATLIRGWTRDGLSMLGGIDDEPYNAVAFSGYHSPAGSGGNVLSHTETARLFRVELNGELTSEFQLNAYACAERKIPVVFLSGDKALCREAEALIPGIVTVATKEDLHLSAKAKHPLKVCEELKEGTRAALTSGHIEQCIPVLPDRFCIEITYKEHFEAARAANFPGAVQLTPYSIRLETKTFREMQKALVFLW